MTSLLQIDQTGRPAGVAGRARTDGLSTGALVTLTNTGTGSTTRMVLHDIPVGDTTAVATLAPTGNPRVWTFVPTAGVFGSYLIEMIEDEGLPTEKRERRIFGIRLQPSGLLIPALNERADEEASIINNGPGYIEESQDNANDYSSALLNQRRYAGWWRKFHELFSSINGEAAYPTAAALRDACNSALPIGGIFRTNGALASGDGYGGTWEIVSLASTSSESDNTGTLIKGTSVAARRRWSGIVEVGWFGARANDSTNDRDAFVAAAALGRPVRAMRGLHRITGGPVDFTSDLIGEGQQNFAEPTKGTGFSLASLTASLRFTGRCKISGLTVFGNYLATHGVQVDNFNSGSFDDVIVRETLRDGVVASETGNNNSATARNLSTIGCGSTYTTGTISATAGDTVLTVTGAGDLTTLGVRVGRDYFSATDDIAACLAAYAASGNPDDLPLPYEIVSVAAGQVEIYPALRHDLTSSAYAIRMGSGVCLPVNGNNGGWVFEGGYHQNNRSAGIQTCALYGSTTIGVTFEANFVGQTVGRRDGSGQVYSFGWGSIRDYYETSTTVDVLAAYARKGVIIDGGAGSHGGTERAIVATYSGSTQPVWVSDRPQLNRQASPYLVPQEASALNRVTVIETSSDFEIGEVAVNSEVGDVYRFPHGTTLEFRAPKGGLRFSRGSSSYFVEIENGNRVFPEGPVFLTRLSQDKWVAVGRDASPLLTLPSGLDIDSALCADYGVTYSGTMRGEGTSPPGVTFTGTPLRPFILDIVTGGARGTATFRYSTNAQATFSPAQATAATVDLTAELGVVLLFSTGTYSGDNLYYPRVSALNDQGGESNHVTQATDSARPTIVRWRGTRRALRFYGAQNLARSTFTGGATSQPVTLFLVGEWPSTGVQTLVDGNTTRLAVYQNSPDAVSLFAGSTLDIGAPIAGEAFVLAATFDGSSSYGLIQFSGGVVRELSAPGAVGSNARNGTVWGADSSGSSNLNGAIALEMVISGRMARRDLWQKFDDLRRYYEIGQ